MDSGTAPLSPEVKNGIITGSIGIVISLVGAFFFGWGAKELLWGIWACSLIYGFVFIQVMSFWPKARARGTSPLLIVIGGIFMTAYFTLLLLIHHVALFLVINLCFPIFESGEQISLGSVGAMISAYWLLIVLTFVSRFSDLPLHAPPNIGCHKDAFYMPYTCPERFYSLIGTLVALWALQKYVPSIMHLAIFPVLLAHFFPWEALNKKRASKKIAAPDGSKAAADF